MPDKLPPAKPEQSPRQAVKEQQKAKEANRKVTEERPTMQQPPSQKSHQPQRKLG